MIKFTMYVIFFTHFIPLKPLALRMDSAKLLDVLTSLSKSHAILPRAMCFATSCLANHAICSCIDLSGYASGPIKRCLFIDYIISSYIDSSGYASGPSRICLFIDCIINVFMVLFIFLYFYHKQFISKKMDKYIFYQNFLHLGENTFIYCGWIIVVHKYANVHQACQNIANGIKARSN